jgi:hypothetical protein
MLYEDLSDALSAAKVALYEVKNLLTHEYRFEALYYKAEDVLDGIIALQNMLPDQEPLDE